MTFSAATHNPTRVCKQRTSMFHTQEEWYKAEYTLPTFFGSLTSHTYRLWSLYTQESHWLVGSKVKAMVSGYFASATPEKRRLHKERRTAWLTCALQELAQCSNRRAQILHGALLRWTKASIGRESSWPGRPVSWTTEVPKEASKSHGKNLSLPSNCSPVIQGKPATAQRDLQQTANFNP